MRKLFFYKKVHYTPLHVSSTVVLIIRRSKLHYTASGIVTPVGGRPVHRSTGAPDGHLHVWWYQMLCNTILTSSWWAQQCSKHVEAWNKIIIKFSASSWLVLRNKYIEMHGQQNIKICNVLFLILSKCIRRTYKKTRVNSQPVHRTATYRVWRYQMLYNTILTSWWWAQQCSKHVEAYNKLIIKQNSVHSVG